jgi:hypothetical protein
MTLPGVTRHVDHTIWIGYDKREAHAFFIARDSIRRFNSIVPVYGVVLDLLRRTGMYTRPTQIEELNGNRKMWDTISEAPMSTEFAISRFLVPHLAQKGWALFVDVDVMFRRNPSHLFSLADSSKAVMCVQHQYEPKKTFKMDNQVQTKYHRKMWSSVMLFNCDHPANKRLTLDMINSVPGRDLHRFCWLEDDEIGALPEEWNYLPGWSKKNSDPSLVHFTEGLPDLPGYENQEFADEWFKMLHHCTRAIGKPSPDSIPRVAVSA